MEQQLKSDHQQEVLKLTDQLDDVKITQAAEMEEQFSRQIIELK